MTQTTVIMWFRHDLRVADNPALTAAAAAGNVVPVFIEDTTVARQQRLGEASKWWLHHSLTALNESLDGKLVVLQGEPLSILNRLVEQTGATAVFWNRGYEAWMRERDGHIKTALKATGIDAISHNSVLLWEPMKVTKKDGSAYKVFTPYYRKGCLVAEPPRFPLSVPQMHIEDNAALGQGIASLNLLPPIPWDNTIRSLWTPGEAGAKARLADFLKSAVNHYQAQRNLPGITGTSLLSPHLRWGEISPNHIWYAVMSLCDGQPNSDLDCYLSELGWREFSYYLLFHFPSLATENFNPKFNHFAWRDDPSALKAWQKGQTGIPIVDAGMRELWQTGYMHNRVRMIVGSFLVKNLGIDWRLGERWFWDCLLDADPASNAASWQWVAGTGADAAPYFRVFNPVLQGEKFDKQGSYVRRFCPELRFLPDKYIHQPWAAPPHELSKARVVLGHNYPSPIVDLAASRQRALAAFSALKDRT